MASSDLASEMVTSALQLAEDGKSLTVDTAEGSFLGQTVTVKVTLSKFDA